MNIYDRVNESKYNKIRNVLNISNTLNTRELYNIEMALLQFTSLNDYFFYVLKDKKGKNANTILSLYELDKIITEDTQRQILTVDLQQVRNKKIYSKEVMRINKLKQKRDDFDVF